MAHQNNTEKSLFTTFLLFSILFGLHVLVLCFSGNDFTFFVVKEISLLVIFLSSVYQYKNKIALDSGIGKFVFRLTTAYYLVIILIEPMNYSVLKDWFGTTISPVITYQFGVKLGQDLFFLFFSFLYPVLLFLKAR